MVDAPKFQSSAAAGMREGLRRLLWRHDRLYKRILELRSRIVAGGYRAWMRRHRLRPADKAAIRRHIERFDNRPMLSVIMVVPDAAPSSLLDAIQSVQAQLYPDWELCVAGEAMAPDLKHTVENLTAADRRVKIDEQALDNGFSAAANRGLNIAQGEFIIFLDPSGVLSEQALYRVAAELNRHPDADILYTDEDELAPGSGWTRPVRRRDPQFKSGWNPDLFYSRNYLSNPIVCRASLVREVGGFREGLEGSERYDLLLRCLAARPSPTVRHIPAILYHQNARYRSTEQPESADHGIEALENYFRLRQIAGVRVEAGARPSTYRVRFPLPQSAPKISVIVPTRNHHQILHGCIESIRERTTYRNYEIVVVDNQSTDEETLRYLDHLQSAGVRVLRYDRPFNYSAINNFAVAQVDGDLIALLNNDIEVITPDWLTEMASHACRPDVGAVGAKLYFGNETIQHGGVILGVGGVAGHSHKYRPRNDPGYLERLSVTQNFSAVTGACLLVRKESYLEVGGFDEVNLTVAFNDVDFCLKLREIGLRNVWTPHAELYHHESVSRGPDDAPDKVGRYRQEVAFMHAKWGEHLRNDPYYNPILTREWESFTPDYRLEPCKPWLERNSAQLSSDPEPAG